MYQSLRIHNQTRVSIMKQEPGSSYIRECLMISCTVVYAIYYTEVYEISCTVVYEISCTVVYEIYCTVVYEISCTVVSECCLGLSFISFLSVFFRKVFQPKSLFCL